MENRDIFNRIKDGLQLLFSVLILAGCTWVMLGPEIVTYYAVTAVNYGLIGGYWGVISFGAALIGWVVFKLVGWVVRMQDKQVSSVTIIYID